MSDIDDHRSGQPTIDKAGRKPENPFHCEKSADLAGRREKMRNEPFRRRDRQSRCGYSKGRIKIIALLDPLESLVVAESLIAYRRVCGVWWACRVTNTRATANADDVVCSVPEHALNRLPVLRGAGLPASPPGIAAFRATAGFHP